MQDKYIKIIEKLGEYRVKLKEPLAKYTYFKIGGPADLYFLASSTQELKEVLILCWRLDVPILLFGRGSNVLVGDKGFRGMVIHNRAAKIRLAGVKGALQKRGSPKKEVYVEAESGAMFNHLVRYTINEGLSGLEEFLGTPGTVGGAIYNNAHFKEKLVGDYVDRAKLLIRNGKEKTVKRAYLKFGYDYSILQKTGEILLSVTFRLEPGKKENLWKMATSSVTRRRETQPLEFPSSGCVWKNVEGGKVSTGYLIDQCGLKGKTIGGAQISNKHANFIVNIGGAKAQDVISLMEIAYRDVKKKFGYDLKPEIFFVGEFYKNPFRKEKI